MIQIVAKYKLKPGVKEEYLRLSKELIDETRKEEGCIHYSIYEEINDSSILAMLEEWKDEDAIVSHNNSDHMKRIIPELKKLRESTEINLYREIDF
ncbi:putative quinol monooxygenase [Clostridium magnum]|uniref:Putative monooxygenase YcnE n=1 Tax=Clostridium magnum DSM 2767 TaxID=1121326 RepID=A0A162QZB6_9CLOT|nr:putative quinol monooxygenase [Clostridium magnum]KZL89184.1 putative monooxygenase YcnE [Clostridium magnum DSM 2767]SHJ24354.1 Quinol monooxygenase YgiN [Clostridium magnum DSM 2767]